MKTDSKNHHGFFRETYLILLIGLLLLSMFIGVVFGSVKLPAGEVMDILLGRGGRASSEAILMSIRIPRVLSVALVGAGLALTGATMQGLLRNPLADGSTLGISAGASLGAVIAIALNISISWISFGGTVVMAMVFAFLSLMIILTIAYKVDYRLNTNTIILLGVIYGMFVSSVRAFIVVFASNKLESITTWSMGSLAGSTYQGAITMAVILAIFGGIILSKSTELDAFAISEENAAHIGIDVRKVKLILMICVSAIIGVSVAFSGTIGFVGLIIPHMMRRIVGPSHNKLMIASIFGGAIFLIYADLIARVVLRPLELPIGVITSFVGTILFIYIYYSMRQVK